MSEAPEPRPWKAAALWLVFLGLFFFASYGLANWLASRRAGVGSIAFDWERHIPFLAWTILPYWSIDLFYAVSPFICSTRRELSVHGRRLLAAQLLCVACFLAFPLRFSFPRPVADGLFGALFTALAVFDKPFNQAPSLHIALLVILWVRYAAHLDPVRWGKTGRAILHIWFSLIAISVLTTYQHHLFDIPTGLWAGLFCLWLIPEKPFESGERPREPMRLRLAIAYGIAGATLALFGLLLGGWGWLLLWPAGALALVGAIYALGDARRFHKADGRLAPPAFWLLLPYLGGAWLNSRLWTWGAPAPVELPGGLLLGRIPTRRELETSGARSLVDLVAELPLDRTGIAYRAVPLLDVLPPSPEEIAAAVAAVDELSGERPTLLCCALGYGRSATVAVAWLLASGYAADLNEAVDQVRRVRPGIALTPAHRRQIAAWHESRRLLDAE